MSTPTYKQFPKEQVHYRPSDTPQFRCGNCIHFKPADESRGFGYCSLVIGRVSSEGLCDLWEPDPLQEPGDTLYELAKRHGTLTKLQGDRDGKDLSDTRSRQGYSKA